MGKLIYFDCFSGCSGDMILGALLDAGLDFTKLKDGLSGLHLNGYHLECERVLRAGVRATSFKVIIEKPEEQRQRNLDDILKIIAAGDLPLKVKEQSSAIFRKLAEAEAKVHGIPVDHVHFHEIGALDSIIDITGTLLALDMLGITEFYTSPLCTGSGTVATQHGILPVPAPATLQILSDARASIMSGGLSRVPEAELLTPTGAVLITSLALFERPEMTIEHTGYGAGNRDFPDWPNVLRVWIGERKSQLHSEEMVLLETNIDDMNPQIYGYLMEKLFNLGALDVWYTPVYMKKNRPGTVLGVLAQVTEEDLIVKTILEETSTLGVRSRRVTRHIARRESVEFDSSLGRIHAKLKYLEDKIISVSPEYDDCRRLAKEMKLPLKEVISRLETELRNKYLPPF